MYIKFFRFFAISVVFCSWVSTVDAARISAGGSIDLDGDFTRESSVRDEEPNVPGDPFTRSIVSAHDTDASIYTYTANSDIGNLEQSIYGQINNTGGTTGSNLETGILTVSSLLQDVLTFESVLAGDYDVIFELVVTGNLDLGSGSVREQARLSFGPNPGSDTHDIRNWTTSGVINETLSVTRTFNGTVDADIFSSMSLVITDADPNAIVTGYSSSFLRMTLPDGVTLVASESGTFMEHIGGSPVPLPAAVWLFGSGLLGLVGIARRKV